MSTKWRFYRKEGSYPKAFFDAITSSGRMLEQVWPNAMRWDDVKDSEIVFVRPASWSHSERLSWEQHAERFGYDPNETFSDLDEIDRPWGSLPPAARGTLHRIQNP